MANSPMFDWHMTHLRNYVNFSFRNAPPVQLGSVKLVAFGQGSGMLRMPGDLTPPSRFVRAVACIQSVMPSKTGAEAILQTFHILNNFAIPKGSARENEKDAHGNVLMDYTLWTSANDLKAKRFYFRTYDKPDPNGGPDEDEPGCKRHRHHSDESGRGYQITGSVNAIPIEVPFSWY